MTVAGSKGLSVTKMQGPKPAAASYTFACGRYNGFSPSISRELISLPMLYPTNSPCELMKRVNSGSGTFHLESFLIFTFPPGPTDLNLLPL